MSIAPIHVDPQTTAGSHVNKNPLDPISMHTMKEQAYAKKAAAAVLLSTIIFTFGKILIIPGGGPLFMVIAIECILETLSK